MFGKDVQQVRVIENIITNVLISEESALIRWNKYFEYLINAENESERQSAPHEVHWIFK